MEELPEGWTKVDLENFILDVIGKSIKDHEGAKEYHGGWTALTLDNLGDWVRRCIADSADCEFRRASQLMAAHEKHHHPVTSRKPCPECERDFKPGGWIRVDKFFRCMICGRKVGIGSGGRYQPAD